MSRHTFLIFLTTFVVASIAQQLPAAFDWFGMDSTCTTATQQEELTLGECVPIPGGSSSFRFEYCGPSNNSHIQWYNGSTSCDGFFTRMTTYSGDCIVVTFTNTGAVVGYFNLICANPSLERRCDIPCIDGGCCSEGSYCAANKRCRYDAVPSVSYPRF